MENEARTRAIKKFLERRETREQFDNSVTSGVMRYEELLKNPQCRDYAFRTAMTHYKLILLTDGVSYEDVYKATQKINKSIARRNGKRTFIKGTEELWELTRTKIDNDSNEVVLQPGKASDVQKKEMMEAAVKH